MLHNSWGQWRRLSWRNLGSDEVPCSQLALKWQIQVFLACDCMDRLDVCGLMRHVFILISSEELQLEANIRTSKMMTRHLPPLSLIMMSYGGFHACERGFTHIRYDLMDIPKKYSIIAKFSWCDPLNYHSHLPLLLRDKDMIDVSYCIQRVVFLVDEFTGSIVEKV